MRPLALFAAVSALVVGAQVVRAAPPTAAESQEAARMALVNAYRAAPKIHRLYRIVRGDGQGEARLEVFREGDRMGWRFWTTDLSQDVLGLTDGYAFWMGPGDPKSQGRADWEEIGALSLRRRAGPLRAALDGLQDRWRVERKALGEYQQAFGFYAGPNAEAPERISFAVQFRFGVDEAPTWLARDAFAAFEDATTPPTLASAKVGEATARIHREDGTLATYRLPRAGKTPSLDLEEGPTRYADDLWRATFDVRLKPPQAPTPVARAFSHDLQRAWLAVDGCRVALSAAPGLAKDAARTAEAASAIVGALWGDAEANADLLARADDPQRPAEAKATPEALAKEVASAFDALEDVGNPAAKSLGEEAWTALLPAIEAALAERARAALASRPPR